MRTFSAGARPLRPLVLLTLVSLVALATGGCGTIMSTHLIVDAEAKLAAAQAAEAETYAVYEYTAASEYLQKAHEELGFADYGPAIDYAFKAAELAARGTARAQDERTKHLDAPLAPASAEPAASSPAQSAPRKVMIKKLDAPASSDTP